SAVQVRAAGLKTRCRRRSGDFRHDRLKFCVQRGAGSEECVGSRLAGQSQGAVQQGRDVAHRAVFNLKAADTVVRAANTDLKAGIVHAVTVGNSKTGCVVSGTVDAKTKRKPGKGGL